MVYLIIPLSIPSHPIPSHPYQQWQSKLVHGLMVPGTIFNSLFFKNALLRDNRLITLLLTFEGIQLFWRDYVNKTDSWQLFIPYQGTSGRFTPFPLRRPPSTTSSDRLIVEFYVNSGKAKPRFIIAIKVN